MTDTFPRQYARTQRLTLGEPRSLQISPDGAVVWFARSTAGDDPVNRLWIADTDTDTEREIVDPTVLLADLVDEAELPPEERARRERLREGAAGITGYSLDATGRRAAFALAGMLFVTDDEPGSARHVDVPGPVFDPHLSPDGSQIGYVRGAELWVADLDGRAKRVAGDDADAVSWGSADFVAAEELHRFRGFWWAPDGDRLAVCRVDDSPVDTWHIADPAAPGSAPRPVRYPAAGTANPEVTLHICALDDDPPIAVAWDTGHFEYVDAVSWNAHGLAVTLRSRDQRHVAVAVVDPDTGASKIVFDDRDDDFVEVVSGTGTLVADRTPVMLADRGGARRLVRGDEILSPADIQVRSIVSATADAIVVTANPLDDATVLHVYRWAPDDGFRTLTATPGVHAAAVGGDTVAIRYAELGVPGGRWTLPGGHQLASHAETPLVEPDVHLIVHTEDDPATAVLLPTDHDGSSLPVLLDPYGGPHAQRVLRSHNAFCASQWFADQGFAVVVADGVGTPGRGSAYERRVRDDFVTGVLDDQVRALELAAEHHPELDLDHVAIRGWSFGGYLAALAVMRRPDVFHAAIAGAPVTEWRLYDTCYTERYLGHPDEQPDVYDANSLLPLAEHLNRPLLLIHGLADDNVVAAHTLQLSSALLAAGRVHEVLPLVGVTHMTPQEVVAENLLLHQLDFLRRHVGRDRSHSAALD